MLANQNARSPGLAQETACSGGINYSDYSIKCRRSLFSAYVMKDPLVNLLCMNAGFREIKTAQICIFIFMWLVFELVCNRVLYFYYLKLIIAKIIVLSLYLNGK